MNNLSEFHLWLDGFSVFSGKPSLHRIEKLLELLENPQNNLKFAHVAGTNGKGSTVKMVSLALANSGYKTGMFISPYITVFNERISINGQNIDDFDLISCANRVKSALNGQTELNPSYFDICTAIAILYFSMQKCDIVVLETGLGGRFDATNFVKSPEITALTSISLDHVAVLGDTIEKIAEEKCGIIKKGTNLVVYPLQTEEAMEIIQKNCKKLEVQFISPQLNALNIEVCDQNHSIFTYKDEKYTLSLLGKHQIYNAITAIEILGQLRLKGYDIPLISVKTALKTAVFSGRMEKLSQNPLVYVDGGHNEDGVRALVDTIKTQFKGYEITIICAMVRDKNVNFCVNSLAPLAKSFIATSVYSDRSETAEAIASIARISCKNVEICDDIACALSRATENLTSNTKSVIIVCGSLYNVSYAKKYFS